MEERLAILERGGNRKIVLTLKEYKKHPYVDIRIFEAKGPGQMQITKKGITLNLEAFYSLKGALEEYQEEIEKHLGAKE